MPLGHQTINYQKEIALHKALHLLNKSSGFYNTACDMRLKQVFIWGYSNSIG